MENLVLSEEVSMRLSDLGGLTTDQFEQAAKYCIECLVKGRSGTAITPDDTTLALATLYAEASKLGLKESAFGTFVDSLGLSSDMQKAMVESYAEYRAGLIFHMQGTGIGGAQVVGYDWRIDYSIRSKDAGRDNEPVIFVTLKVLDQGTMRDIAMVCSREELTALVATLREGCKEVDRLIKAD